MTSRRTSITWEPGNGWRRIGERRGRGKEVADLVHSGPLVALSGSAAFSRTSVRIFSSKEKKLGGLWLHSRGCGRWDAAVHVADKQWSRWCCSLYGDDYMARGQRAPTDGQCSPCTGK